MDETISEERENDNEPERTLRTNIKDLGTLFFRRKARSPRKHPPTAGVQSLMDYAETDSVAGALGAAEGLRFT